MLACMSLPIHSTTSVCVQTEGSIRSNNLAAVEPIVRPCGTECKNANADFAGRKKPGAEPGCRQPWSVSCFQISLFSFSIMSLPTLRIAARQVPSYQLCWDLSHHRIVTNFSISLFLACHFLSDCLATLPVRPSRSSLASAAARRRYAHPQLLLPLTHVFFHLGTARISLFC
jgi:hypothetical protein